MKIHINNIGQIGNSGSIMINGLTVIAGVNNTGKSTLSRSLFASLASLNQYKTMIKNSKKTSIGDIFDEEIEDMSSTFDDYLNFKKQLEEKIDESISNQIQFDEFYQSLLTMLKLYSNNSGYEAPEEIKNKFYQFVTTSDDEILTSNATNIFRAEFYNQFSNVDRPDETSIITLNINNQDTVFEIQEDKVSKILNPVELKFQPIFLDESMNVSGMMPQHFFRRNNRFYANHVQRLTEALNEKEKLYNDLDNESLNLNNLYLKKKVNKVLEKVESVIPNNLKIKGFKSQSKNFSQLNSEINMNNISSGLKSFVNLKKLLQNETLTENGTLILDEPEIHLHPEWQIVFAEIIVLIQKEFGMHILLTTHSPYFLQAIQVFSEKYDIENKTEYYVSEVNSEGFSRFINTTKDVGTIYTLLAKPFELLNSIESEMKESRGN